MSRQTIVLHTGESGKGDKEDERAAGGAITPGHLIKVNSSDAVVVHATSGGICEPIFAKEMPLFGKTIDDAYASGDVVLMHKADRGDIINAILAVSQTIAIGAELMSNGDGTLTAKTSTNYIVGYAEEAVTTTGAVKRIPVRIA